MMVEDKSFTFRLPEGLWSAIQHLAKSQDLSAAQLVRRVLKEFVADIGVGQKEVQ